MKRFQVNKHFRLDIAFQSIIRFQLYCGRSVNPLEPQDSPEKPEHVCRIERSLCTKIHCDVENLMCKNHDFMQNDEKTLRCMGKYATLKEKEFSYGMDRISFS